MKPDLEHLKEYANPHPIFKIEGKGLNGYFEIPSPIDSKRTMRVLSSDGMGWDHVSISMNGRCPNWIEMSHIKDLFFTEDETVIQFHPKKTEYVNSAPTCLHLWRNQNEEHELPNSLLVGLKGESND